MLIFPAIDILNGSVVRLYKGDYGCVRNYSVTCEKAASDFKACGAEFIHVVDLDGAKSGIAENYLSVKRIIERSGCFVEVGGGIRSEKQIKDYLSAGAGRVIIGTAAVRDFGFVERAVRTYGDRIAVGVDALDERVAVSGWREVTEINSFDFCRKLADAGVKNVIYTDISRDGALSGANLEAYEKLVGIDGLEITASGGVSSIEELLILKQTGVYAVILGKSLYERKIDLTSALRAAGCGYAG